MARRRTYVILTGAAVAAAVAALRHRRAGMGREVPGGILIRDAGVYDALTHRLLLGSLFARIAADIAVAAPSAGRVLEVGCGPGHLAILLANQHGLDVTGIDLDPAMIRRARVNASRPGTWDGGRPPSFLVGNVSSLPFPDESFDLVVSTLSMHHWADPTAGLAEIDRVLRPDGRVLVWDFRPGVVPLHGRLPDPLDVVERSSLRVTSVSPWRWPWRLSLTRRIELLRSGSPSE